MHLKRHNNPTKNCYKRQEWIGLAIADTGSTAKKKKKKMKAALLVSLEVLMLMISSAQGTRKLQLIDN